MERVESYKAVTLPAVLIHRSAWKGNSLKFACWGFSKVCIAPVQHLLSVPNRDRHSSGIIPTLGTCGSRFSELIGASPGVYRRRAARVTAGVALVRGQTGEQTDQESRSEETGPLVGFSCRTEGDSKNPQRRER